MLSDFRQYRRKHIAELRPYVPGEDLSGVSISAPDKEGGSPKVGDMIARNPKNHKDQWLVAEQYFKDNFEPIEAAPQPSGTVKVDDIAAIIYSEMEWASALPGDPGEPIISWDDCDDSPAFAKGRARAAARRILSALTAGGGDE